MPLPDETPDNPVRRKEIGREVAAGMALAWPNMKSMHPIGAESYEEETALLAHGFISMMFISLFHLPSYVSWQFHQDHASAYRELKTWLQVLQYNDPSRRGRKWLLKRRVTCWRAASGPRSRLSRCQGDPVAPPAEQVVAPSCGLQYEMIQAAAHPFERSLLGPEALELFSNGFRTLKRVRSRHPERFVDVTYGDLVEDPLGQFRRLLRAMGLEPTPEDERSMQNWMSLNRRDTHPPHRYSLEDSACGSQGHAGIGVQRAVTQMHTTHIERT